MSAGTVTLGTPLANGASVNIHLLFGIQQNGTYNIKFTPEILPGSAVSGVIRAPVSFVSCTTPDAVATPSSQEICSGSTITTIALTGTVSGTVFDWTRDNTVSVTGIGASGTGDISGALTNTTNFPVTVTFTITPTSGTCVGTPITATVVVNPLPQADDPSDQVVCNNTATAAVNFTSPIRSYDL